MDRFYDIMQRVGRSFMLPISILPIAGFLLGIGSTMTNETVIEMYSLSHILGPGTLGHAIFLIIFQAGSIIFNNLPLIFAIGVSIGMSKNAKEIAALSSVVCYLIMNASINACLILNDSVSVDGSISSKMITGSVTKILGITTFQTGAFGGIMVGLLVAYLNNRFHKIELPIAFSFFQGNRFVPIISVVLSIPLGILTYYIWPVAQYIICNLGTLVQETGYLGTFFYGLGKRMLLPFGLHHVFYLPFWQTAMGGSMMLGDHLVEGAQNIFFAQLADPGTVKFSTDACRFFTGEFFFMICGLPGAAWAIYDTADKDQKGKIKGILISSLIPCVLTGITEPLEFTFLFAAPVLYGIHCILAGFAYAIAHILQITVGLTFSGGLIDFILFGVLQGNEKTNWLLAIPVGLVYFALYFLIFRYLILRWNLPTLGRSLSGKSEGGIQSQREISQEEYLEFMIQGLGGVSNIEYVDSCATRIRCRIYNLDLMQMNIIEKSGSSAIMQKGHNIQIIHGPMAGLFCRKIQERMDSVNTSHPEHVEDQSESTKEIVWQMPKKIEEAPQNNITLEPEMIYSFANGQLIPLKDVDDIVFSSGLLGDGFAILLVDDKIYSPVDGVIKCLYDTKHAIGIQSDHGADLLLHIGIDTARLKGKAFDIMVKEKQRVKKGDLLCTLDKSMILQQGLSITSPLVITNIDSYKSFNLCKSQFVEVGDAVLETIIS